MDVTARPGAVCLCLNPVSQSKTLVCAQSCARETNTWDLEFAFVYLCWIDASLFLCKGCVKPVFVLLMYATKQTL